MTPSMNPRTQRPKREPDTVESLAPFAAASEVFPDAFLFLDDVDRIVLINGLVEEMFGHGRGAMVGAPIQLLFPQCPSFQPPNAATAVPSVCMELQGCHRSGHMFPVELSYAPRTIDGRRLVAVALRNVTERKLAEERFRRLLETAPDAKVLVNADGKILFVNAQAEHLFGYKRHELLGECVEILIPHRYRDQHPGNRAKYFADPYVRPMRKSPHFYGLRKDGTEFPAELSLSPLETKEGTVVSTAVRDITERLQAEEQLLQHQADLAHVSRLNTMGEMAAGLAHELNQPLYAITNYARACQELVKGEVLPTARLVEICGKLIGQSDRAAQIIRRLKRFISRREPRFVDLQLNDLVREVEQLMHFHAHRFSMSLQLDLAADLPGIRGDPIQLEQILVNLLRNSFEAMHEAHSPQPVVTVTTRTGQPGTVEVRVADTGPGFGGLTDAELFEAFFTTKEQGMGLGLVISRSIAEAHRGKLFAEPNQNGGATFRLVLPIAGGKTDDA